MAWWIPLMMAAGGAASSAMGQNEADQKNTQIAKRGEHKIYVPPESNENAMGIIGGGLNGYSAGSSGGFGMATGIANMGAQVAQNDQVQGGAVQEPNAMQRRMDKISEDPYEQLKKARLALSYQEPEIQREYAPTLDKAIRNAEYSQKGSLYGSSSTAT
jgi:hypothetical protein